MKYFSNRRKPHRILKKTKPYQEKQLKRKLLIGDPCVIKKTKMPKKTGPNLGRRSRKTRLEVERKLKANPQASQEKIENHQIEKVVFHRHLGGKLEYLIKWEGFFSCHNSWETSETCSHISDFKTHIIEYWLRRQADYSKNWNLEDCQQEPRNICVKNDWNINLNESYGEHKKDISVEPKKQKNSLKNLRIEKYPIRSNELRNICVKNDWNINLNESYDEHKKDISVEPKKKKNSLKKLRIEKCPIRSNSMEENAVEDDKDNGDDSSLQDVKIAKYFKMWKVLYPEVDVQEQKNIYEKNNRNVRQTMVELRQLNKERTQKIPILMNQALRKISGIDPYVVDHVSSSDKSFGEDYDDKTAAVEQGMKHYLISKQQTITGNQLSSQLELQMQQHQQLQMHQRQQQQHQPPVTFDDDDMEPSFLIKLCLLNIAIKSLCCQQCGQQTLKFIKSGESLLSELSIKCTECLDIRYFSTSKPSTNEHLLDIGGGEYISLGINPEAQPVSVPVPIPNKKVNEEKCTYNDTNAENSSSGNGNTKTADSGGKSVVTVKIEVDESEETEVKIEEEQDATSISDTYVEHYSSGNTKTADSGGKSVVKIKIEVDESENTEVKIEKEQDATSISDTSIVVY